MEIQFRVTGVKVDGSGKGLSARMADILLCTDLADVDYRYLRVKRGSVLVSRFAGDCNANDFDAEVLACSISGGAVLYGKDWSAGHIPSDVPRFVLSASVEIIGQNAILVVRSL